MTTTPDTPADILIVDDHPVVGHAIAGLIESLPGCRLHSHVSSIDDAREILADAPPRLVILDLILSSESGFDLLWMLAHEHPRTRTIVYSVQPARVYATRCLRAGAHGYLEKSSPMNIVARTVERVLAGDTVVNGDPVPRPTDADDPAAPTGADALSRRELEILCLLGQGLSNTAIAARLSRSPKTVETHRYRLARKLGVRNGPELVHYAIRHVLAMNEAS